MSETKYIHCERMEKRISRAVCAILWKQANTGAGTDKMVAPNVCRGCEQGEENHRWRLMSEATKTPRH